LGTLGGKNSAALAINARGDVVGTAERADGQRHAFVWRAGGTELVDLSTKERPLDDARGIDTDGSIIANAAAANGTETAWLLQDGAEPVQLKAVSKSGEPLLAVHASAVRAGHIVGWGVVAAQDEQQPVRCLTWTVER
jgi:probable HAF family extracellular repeat protein